MDQIKRKIFIGFAILFIMPAWGQSVAIQSLDNFFNHITTFKARFGQVVLDENLNTLDSSEGTVWVHRPDRFRWDYGQPDEQQIVGDGEKVWSYDVELEQVVVQKQQSTLGKSLAVLLAGSGELKQSYIVEDIGTQGRYDWVNLIPKNQNSDFSEIRIGFEKRQLRLMELLDTLGQRTRISFVDLNENIAIDDQMFVFKLPSGVDVIDETDE